MISRIWTGNVTRSSRFEQIEQAREMHSRLYLLHLLFLFVFLAGDAREMRLNELRFIRAATTIRFVTVYTPRSFLSLETRDEF